MNTLRLCTLAAALASTFAFTPPVLAQSPQNERGPFALVHHLAVDGVAEIVTATPNGLTLLYTSADAGALGLVDITDPARPVSLPRIDVRLGGVGEPTSVAISPDGRYAVVALRLDDDVTNPRRGFLRVYDVRNPRAVQHVKDLSVGIGPDSLALAGSGKTLLRQALVASTNKQSVQSVVVSARGAGDAAGVLRQVAQALDVATAEPNAILKQVVQLGLTGQEVYLLVDDAEQLDESALEALMALGAGAPEGRPHVFLFGESSLIAQLEALHLEEERFHVIELQPYTEEETREYLDQRLEGAGRGVELFTADQISDIHESAEGWPGNINQVARDALIEVMIASRSAVKRPSMGFNMPKKHVLAISAVVVVAVAAAWLMPGRNKAPTTGAPANEQAQLPLGQGAANGGAPNVEFAGNTQPMPLPLVGNSQPVMRGPLAEAAGGITEGDDGVPLEGSSDTPPTVTTSAPPAGVPAGPAPTPTAKPEVPVEPHLSR